MRSREAIQKVLIAEYSDYGQVITRSAGRANAKAVCHSETARPKYSTDSSHRRGATLFGFAKALVWSGRGLIDVVLVAIELETILDRVLGPNVLETSRELPYDHASGSGIIQNPAEQSFAAAIRRERKQSNETGVAG